MSGKTIFIIVVTVLVTVILMNNTEEIDFWIFGITRIPKLAVLGTMLIVGFILGFLAGRPRRKTLPYTEPADETAELEEYRSKLSDEDRDYIS
ncbi:hypothetical protein [Arcticibacter sp. MXS-1]|uniref:hypothetical protein n=1 Tax=Arcticibacter sp. MXS-1 TaxID=3341726 RepID=UPI0035A89913